MRCPACGQESRNVVSCDYCFNPLSGAQGAAAPGYLQPHPTQPPPAPATSAPAIPTAAAAPQMRVAASGPPAPLDLTQPIAPNLGLTQPISAGLDLTQPVMHGGNVRMSLTGEIVEVSPPANYMQPAAAATPLSAVPARPMPHSAVVRDLPPGAISPHMMKAARYDEVTLGEKWEKCLALMLPTLLAAVVCVRFFPTAYLWIELGALFLAALYMGATGAVGSYEEAFAECMGILIISYFFGPIVGLGGCILLGVVRQEMNAPVTWLLGVHIAARFMFIVSAGTLQGLALYSPEGDLSMLLPHVSLFSAAGFISFFIVCASFAGWMMSSFFRPVNEA